MKFIDLFKNIVNYYRTGDSEFIKNIGITSKDALLSIANNAFEDTKEFLEKSVIIPLFYTDDSQKLFETYCQVFAALRTISIIRKQIVNPFAAPDDAVLDFLTSYGFDVAHLFDEGTRRYILADLFNIYKQTGTVGGIATLMKLLGFPFVTILEHWVNAERTTGRYIIDSTVAYGQTSQAGVKFYVNDNIIQKDPLWRLTEQDIATLEATENWKVPSKTSYFSVLAQYDIFGTDIKMSSLMASLIGEELEEYENQGIITNKQIACTFYNHNVSFVEMILALMFCLEQPYNAGWGWDPSKVPEQINVDRGHYLFNTSTPAELNIDSQAIENWLLGISPALGYTLPNVVPPLTAPQQYNLTTRVFDDSTIDRRVRHLSYNGPIITGGSIVDTIVSTYHNIVDNIQSSNYRDREKKLKDFIDIFTQKGAYIVVDAINKTVGQKLYELNPDFYEFVATKVTNGQTSSLIDYIFQDLQAYFIAMTGVYFQFNPSIDVKKVWEAINFIKPYRARPLVLSAANTIKDPLDTIYFHEKIRTHGKINIKCDISQYDTGVRYDNLVFDIGKSANQHYRFNTRRIYDAAKFFYDEVGYSSLLNHDRGLYFDQLRHYDDNKMVNSNMCNLLELKDEVRRFGYVIIKRSYYSTVLRTPSTGTTQVEPLILENFQLRLETTLQNIVSHESELATLRQQEQTDETIKRIEILEQQLNFMYALKDYEQSQVDYFTNVVNNLVEKGVLENAVFDHSFFYDMEDTIEFKEKLIVKRHKPAFYDSDCYYDVSDESQYDKSIVITEITKINL